MSNSHIQTLHVCERWAAQQIAKMRLEKIWVPSKTKTPWPPRSSQALFQLGCGETHMVSLAFYLPRFMCKPCSFSVAVQNPFKTLTTKSSLGKTLTKLIIINHFTISCNTGINSSHQMTKPRKLEMIHFNNSQQVLLNTRCTKTAEFKTTCSA